MAIIQFFQGILAIIILIELVLLFSLLILVLFNGQGKVTVLSSRLIFVLQFRKKKWNEANGLGCC